MLFGAFALAVLLTLFCASTINHMIEGHIQYSSLKITVLNPRESGVILLERNSGIKNDGNAYSISFDTLQEGLLETNNGFGLKQSDPLGKQLIGSKMGETLRIKVAVRPETNLLFYRHTGGGVVQISHENHLINLDTDVSVGEDEHVIYYYPYQVGDASYLVYIQLFYNAAFAIFFFLAILMLYRFRNFFSFLKKGYNENVLFYLIVFGTFLVLWSLYLLDPGKYQVSPPADAAYYMYPIIHDGDGNITLKAFVDNMYSFRGYLPSMISLGFLVLGTKLGFQPIIAHYAFISIFLGIAFAVGIPRAYQAVRGHKASWMQALSLYVIFCIFFGNDMFFVLSDIPSAIGAATGLAFLTVGLYKGDKTSYFLGGLFMGVACSYRASYALLANITILFLGMNILVKWIILKTTKESSGDLRLEFKDKLKSSFKATLFLVGLVIVLLPQFFINLYKGHHGLYPYDIIWGLDSVQGYPVSLTESSIDHGLQSYYFGQPKGLDEQMAETIQGVFPNKSLKHKDVVYIALKKPLDFSTIVVKKAFWGLDKQPGGTYVGARIQSEAFFNVYRSLNYLTWLGAAYVLFKADKGKGQYLSLNVKASIAMILMITLLPQALMHIEYRYFVFPLLLLEFIFVYFSLERVGLDTEGNGNQLGVNSIMFIILGLILLHGVHLTFVSNFLS